MAYQIKSDFSPYLSVVYFSNGKPLFDTLSIESDTDIENLTLQVTTTPEYIEPQRYEINKLTANSPLDITPATKTNYDLAALKSLTEEEPGQIHFSLYQGENLLCKESGQLTWLPANVWVMGIGAKYPELLAALVQPNDPAVDKVLHHAGELLANMGLSPDWSGYRSTPNDILNKLHAIWLTLSNYGINYATPARGEIDLENRGAHQKVRTPSQIMQGGCATCLDSTLLMAAVIAQAGFNPLVIQTKGHAFVGVFLKDENLPQPIVKDCATIRTLMELGDILVLETTMLTRSEGNLLLPFEAARDKAEQTLRDTDFVRVYDIVRIWSGGVRPISTERPENAPSIVNEHTCSANVADFLPEETADVLEREQSLVTDRKRTRMENWQLKLLDLSMRNNLLNCHIDKSQVEIILKNAAKFEDDLSNGKVFRLSGLPLNYTLEEAFKKEDKSEANAIIEHHATEMYAKNELLTMSSKGIISDEELQKKLYKLYLTARKNLEESGYNTLYIACGFLRWVRKEKNQVLHAPLLLIPVRISRKSVKSPFTLRTTDEETRLNLTLLELLKTEYGLTIPELAGELPTDNSGINVAGIFEIVRRAIKDIEGWEVLNTCTLGVFSFAKYLMWKDLCDRQAELMTNPIVRHLADENRETFPAQVGFPAPDELDSSVDAEQVYTPLSADSSQLSAILAAGRGKNFVLIGPPGTGKSQTISNMIAHCLGHGKTVLFVAEKAAALSVVYNRLKRIGLGDFCLELHSNKAIKKEVLAQFKAAIDNVTEKNTGGNSWEKAVSDMLSIRTGLNLLPQELHRLYPDATSLYDDINLLAEAPIVPLLPKQAEDLLNVTESDMGKLLDYTRELSMQFSSVCELYPGYIKYLVNTHYTMQWDDTLAELLPRVSRAAERWDTALNKLMEQVGLVKDDYADKRHIIAELLLLAAQTHGQDNTPLLPATATTELLQLKEALSAAENYRQCQSELTLPYPEGTEDAPAVPALYRQWKEALFSNFITRFFTNRKIRKSLQMLAFSHKKPNIERDLQNLTDMQRYKTSAALTAPALPQFRKGIHIGQHDYEAACQMAEKLQKLASIESLCKLYLSVEGNPITPGSPAAQQAATLRHCTEEYHAILAELAKLLGAPLKGTETEREGAVAAITHELLAQRNKWRQVIIWNECAAKADSEITRALVSKLQSGELKHTDIEIAVRVNYSRERLRAAVDSSRTLTYFDAPTHERHIDNFCSKDEQVLKSARAHLQVLLKERAQQHTTHAKEMAELNHELNKQRAHKSIRKLLSLTPNVSRMLKPCMLMSPLSVAQYLSTDSEPFDVVIFDEASQIPVWDAIGAIGRGKSAVIVGDPRQMPPTNFFARSKPEDAGDEEVEQDLESILDECLACGIPQMNLNWHYRSKSESLIAYSNHNYYDNKLMTFPAPVENDTALQYHYVAGVYEKGATKRYNKKEAQALIDHVLSVLRSPGFDYNEQTSIGIVTFNAQQQNLIQDMLDRARAEDESLEPFFNEENPEAIFVKNLENVQGDERGVIYFSTTYGPDEKGAISMNFGPLNLTGGERRLNVAITRARTGMRVFSSLKPEDIDLNRTRARGAADLRGFLECARMGAGSYFKQNDKNNQNAEYGLQRAICKALQAYGWQCINNLGVSGYRIDIAIAHPEQAGNMLAGIVLDGPTYAAAATARDRDLLRESVLRSLGWNIRHIWALDWWRDPQNYAARIDKQLRNLLQNKQ